MKKYLAFVVILAPLVWLYENSKLKSIQDAVEQRGHSHVLADDSTVIAADISIPSRNEVFATAADGSPGYPKQKTSQNIEDVNVEVEVDDLKHLKSAYIDHRDDEIEEEITYTRREIESDDLIARSNENALDSLEKQRLSKLMQKLDALRLIKVQRKLDRLKELAARPLASRSGEEQTANNTD